MEIDISTPTASNPNVFSRTLHDVADPTKTGHGLVTDLHIMCADKTRQECFVSKSIRDTFRR